MIPNVLSYLIIRALLLLLKFSKIWNTFILNTDAILLNKLNDEIVFSGYSLHDYIPYATNYDTIFTQIIYFVCFILFQKKN